MNFDYLSRACTNLADSLASIIKVPLMSGRPSPKMPERPGTVIIMGNGPSLRDAIDNHADILMSNTRLAVNLSALTPDFKALKPEYYILADPAFFAKKKSGKIPMVWEALKSVDWPMTLYLPAKARKMPETKELPDCVTVKWYNLTPAEGWKRLTLFLFRKGLSMPRPRNVLIPAIMSMIREGFRNIVLTGADHNWARTLWVTDRNRVVSVQPHFYKDDDAELKRAEEVYRNLHLHDVYGSYAVTFKSYFDIKDYADSLGVNIINATPESFIDAFPRARLEDMK